MKNNIIDTIVPIVWVTLIIVGLGLLVVLMVKDTKKQHERDIEYLKTVKQETISNEVAVQKMKFCYDNGVEAEEVYNTNKITYEKYLTDIKCVPRKQPEINQGKKSNATMIITN